MLLDAGFQSTTLPIIAGALGGAPAALAGDDDVAGGLTGRQVAGRQRLGRDDDGLNDALGADRLGEVVEAGRVEVAHHQHTEHQGEEGPQIGEGARGVTQHRL